MSRILANLCVCVCTSVKYIFVCVCIMHTDNSLCRLKSTGVLDWKKKTPKIFPPTMDRQSDICKGNCVFSQRQCYAVSLILKDGFSTYQRIWECFEENLSFFFSFLLLFHTLLLPSINFFLLVFVSSHVDGDCFCGRIAYYIHYLCYCYWDLLLIMMMMMFVFPLSNVAVLF